MTKLISDIFFYVLLLVHLILAIRHGAIWQMSLQKLAGLSPSVTQVLLLLFYLFSAAGLLVFFFTKPWFYLFVLLALTIICGYYYLAAFQAYCACGISILPALSLRQHFVVYLLTLALGGWRLLYLSGSNGGI